VDRQFVEEAKKIGVRAFVAKTKAGEALVKSIEEAVTSGEFVLMD
jgi:DNA-binding NarL/FixJ family response regulator